MAPVYALIVAGGRGSRAGGGVPKQYRRLGGVPVLRRTVQAFLAQDRVARVQVVIHPDDAALYAEAIGDLDLPPPVHGGATRQASVRLGLAALPAEPGALVMIHDAARALVPVSLLVRCIARADAQAVAGETVSIVPALPATDSLRRGSELLREVVDRTGLLRVQTPQLFDLATIGDLHDRFAGADLTDDAALMMHAGLPVTVVEGDERNIKLTTPQDFARAEDMLAARTSIRTGMGFDVHVFEPGDHVWIGGLQIPYGRGLKGHSDADVALHALTDALLGAICAGDIGVHFPPSDPQWRGAASHLFLEHARDLIATHGGRIEHVDLTIICEAPKIGPHREPMRENIAALLRLPLQRVSVKATTTERLGFTGRGEGIAAQAVATVRVEEGDIG